MLLFFVCDFRRVRFGDRLLWTWAIHNLLFYLWSYFANKLGLWHFEETSHLSSLRSNDANAWWRTICFYSVPTRYWYDAEAANHYRVYGLWFERKFLVCLKQNVDSQRFSTFFLVVFLESARCFACLFQFIICKFFHHIQPLALLYVVSLHNKCILKNSETLSTQLTESPLWVKKTRRTRASLNRFKSTAETTLVAVQLLSHHFRAMVYCLSVAINAEREFRARPFATKH